MSVRATVSAWVDRIIFGRIAIDALAEAERRIEEVERHADECRRHTERKWVVAESKVDAAVSEMRKTPRDKPRILWPTPPTGVPPVPFTPWGPTKK
jgi:hypothetical protein